MGGLNLRSFAGSARPFLFYSRHKSIAHAVDRLQVCRLLRFRLDLLSHPPDIDIHASRSHRPVIAPNAIEQLIARKDQARMRREVVEQSKFESA